MLKALHEVIRVMSYCVLSHSSSSWSSVVFDVVPLNKVSKQLFRGEFPSALPKNGKQAWRCSLGLSSNGCRSTSAVLCSAVSAPAAGIEDCWVYAVVGDDFVAIRFVDSKG